MGKGKTMLKRGLIGVITVLAIGLGWLSWLNYAAGERVAAAREAIVKAGRPIHIKDLYSTNVPDADNAFVEFAKWKEEIKVADAAVSGTREKQTPYLEDRKLTPEEIDELAAILAAHQVMIDDLVVGSKKKQLRIPIDVDKPETVVEELLNRSQEFRSIARVLSANVRLKIAQGKNDEALENAVAILRWSQLTTQQPTLVSYLVALAVRGIGISYAAEVLYAGPVQEESLKELEAVLLSFETNDVWKNTVYSEIPFFVDVFHPQMPVATRHLWFSLNAEADYLETMRMSAERPVVKDGVFAKETAEKGSVLPTSWIVVSVLPALNAAEEATKRVEAQTRCVLALSQWRRQGATAIDIKDLQLRGNIAIDPYDGGALKARVSEVGLVFYTVGNNRVDDGGDKSFLTQADVGVLPLELRIKLAEEE
jgi:hypothetical protein